MSTRATYKLTEDTYHNDTISIEVYIHYDGYIEGASEYFSNAIKHKQENGRGFIASFIRANPYAEATIASSHGDTEYHYIMSKTEVKAYKIDYKTDKHSLIGIYTADEFMAISDNDN